MANYEKSNIWWQIQRTQQRLWEWVEWQLNKSPRRVAEPEPPPAFLQWLAPYITWFLGIVLVGLLLYLIFRVYRAWQLKQATLSPFRGESISPSEPVLTLHERLTQAQKFRQQRQFTQAARALYFAMLENLDKRQVIVQQSSRTDREYAAMTQKLPQPDAFDQLLQTHERLEFAGGELSAQEFEQCQQAYEQTDKAITQVAAENAVKRSTEAN